MTPLKKVLYSIAVCVGIFCCWTCQSDSNTEETSSTQLETAKLINTLNRDLTKVVSEDLFVPPVAARIYAYCNLAAYEAVRGVDMAYPSFSGQLNQLNSLEVPKEPMAYELALITAYTKVAKHLVYREHLVDTFTNRAIHAFVLTSDAAKRKAGETWGAQVADHIIKWADQDGYVKTRNMPKYVPLGQTDTWVPTQPTFGEALEPHWPKIRPFIMDSSSQFRLEPPLAFSEDKESEFYQACKEVYDMVQNADSSHYKVAVYWDCNPGPTMVDGHVMQVRKQNTPGGHWMGIHSILARDQKANLLDACRTNALLMTGIADAFIAAWETKYHYHLLRPETYINKHIDPDWKPSLESPLFPEYASAHSAVSGVAATILTAAYGETPFFDDTNIFFGIPPKQFDHVWQAAEEAAKSRLMGGIHYRFGCEAGLEQGKALGAMIVDEFKFSTN